MTDVPIMPIPAAGQDSRSSPPLRLRLHHLFALTAVMAVLLAIQGPYREFGGFEMPALLQVTTTALGIVSTILASVATTIVVYGIGWRRHGYRFFSEPGHWLLVVIAMETLLGAITTLGGWILATIRGESMVDLWQGVAAYFTTMFWLAFVVLILVLNVYIGRTKCHESRWSRVFYSKAAASIVPVLGELLVLLFLERAVRADNPRRRRRSPPQPRGFVPPVAEGQQPRVRRDRLHWCGVVIQFIMSGLMVAVLFGVLIWAYLNVFSP